MPDHDRRQNPYPYPTQEDVDAAPGDRVEKAARNVATRAFQGIPQRAFLLGDADHSPVMRSIREFIGPVYELLDDLAARGIASNHADKVREMLAKPVLRERDPE